MRPSCLGDRMGTPGRTVDRKLARIASGGHGVVTRAHLLSAGVTARQIRRRVERGNLIRVHRGVYRVGHRAPSLEATYLAAVLAAGESALLFGRAAAHLLRIVKGTAPAPEVTARTQRRIEGVKTHRCRLLDARDATTVHGIPVTTVPRTLIDIAPGVSLNALARACHEAGVRYGTTPGWSRPSLQDDRAAQAPGSSGESSTATSTSPSANSKLISWSSYATQASHFP